MPQSRSIADQQPPCPRHRPPRSPSWRRFPTPDSGSRRSVEWLRRVAVAVSRRRAGACLVEICLHAGRRLDWAPGQFLKTKGGHLVCAAHGAAFELSSGECISGPCRGQSLLTVPVRIEGEHVLLG
ncbi:hypothetical protein O1K_15374 [Xanthomonas fragariae LMG 25863]|nr:hypothetical protein O1K_15374 [Xanthomonas fragariae LMG 25863]